MWSGAGITTTRSDEEDSDLELAIRGVSEQKSSRGSSEPSEQEHSDCSIQKTSPAALEGEGKNSKNSKQTGKWKVQLEKSRIEYKSRRMQCDKKLLDIDRQIMELRVLANQIIYR